MRQFDTIVSEIKRIAIDAGSIMTDLSVEHHDICYKTSSKDLVTECDKTIQTMIISEISRLIPDAQFISEEGFVSGGVDSKNLFIIDPIDGTTNFVHLMDYSAVSIAWYKENKQYYGIVYNPYTKEIYEAQYQKGAFLNDKRISVSKDPLRNSIVTFGTAPYNTETTDETFEMVKAIYKKCQDIRRTGSSSLDICRVAAGKTGLYFEAALSIWDYAAAQIILNEAGGYLCDFSGEIIGLSDQKRSVIAGSKEAIAESDLIKKRN